MVHHSLGYHVLGYMQLWNPKESGFYDYPIQNSGFDRTDVVHFKRWSKENIGFIPDLVCIHLASEDHAQGQNWLGRKTNKFEPKLPKPKSLLKKELNKFFRKVYFNIFKIIYWLLGFAVNYIPDKDCWIKRMLRKYS
jgi:hypothetical protein